jgi:complex III assembly factor LYRM7
VRIIDGMMALAAYRQLLRATRIAFTGDHHLLHAARTQARQGFDNNSSLEPTSKEATDAVKHAEGVAEILKHNIVQGKRGDDPNVLSKCQS